MPDLLTRACAQCHSDCKTCLGATDKNCTSCSDPLKVLHNQMCLSTCPTKFFKGENGMCVACHRTCQECAGRFESNCTKCIPELFLNSSNFCSPDCSELQFTNSISGKCDSCIEPCFACFSKEQCLSCVDGYFLLQVGNSS